MIKYRNKLLLIASILPIFLLLVSSVLPYNIVDTDEISPDQAIQQTNYGDINGDGEEGKKVAVYGFSQGGNSVIDPQVLSFKPDMVIRAWNKWDTSGNKPRDFNFEYVKQCHDKNIIFIGGITASVLFETECASHEQLLDWATRDASNNLVLHKGLNNFRGSMANPSYRQYLVDMGKIQIDGGVDGIFYDEADGAYFGADHSNNYENEGFDDYFCKDFNKYLMEKYPNYTKEDWKSKFKMTDDNIISKEYPYDDLQNNFNYRTYLAKHGWANSPFTSVNPLASVWGHQTVNRPENSDRDFRAKYMMIYWKDIVDSLREYALTKYNKEILITSNGIFPYVDFQSVGLYEYNNDHSGGEANYVPVKGDGHLDGSYSLIDDYIWLKERNQQIAGDNVPVVLFIDWPTKIMNDYYALPLEEKKDFWRIYGAESYACGLYFAFHLKTSMPGEPTAKQSGIFDFLKEYSAFYKNNESVYNNSEFIKKLDINADNINATLTRGHDGKTEYVHLINHNYDNSILTQKNITLNVELEKKPVKVEILSPDYEECKLPDYSYEKGILTIKVDSLYSYDVVRISK